MLLRRKLVLGLAVERRDIGAKSEHIRRAMALVDALRDCLNMTDGGELAANLDALYEYIGRQIALANAKLQYLNENPMASENNQVVHIATKQ